MNISAISSASLGIQRNMANLDAAAHRIANPPIGADTVRDISDLKMAQHGVNANVAMLRVANEMAGQLVDILA